MKENKTSRKRNREDMKVWLRDQMKRWRKMSLEEMEEDVKMVSILAVNSYHLKRKTTRPQKSDKLSQQRCDLNNRRN